MHILEERISENGGKHLTIKAVRALQLLNPALAARKPSSIVAYGKFLVKKNK